MLKKYFQAGICLTVILVCESSSFVNASVEDAHYNNSIEVIDESLKEGDVLEDERASSFVAGWNGEIEKGNKCYLDKFGNRLVGLQKIEEKTYYFNLEGILQTGWQEVTGQVFYFSPETGERYENGNFIINGENWYFDGFGIGVNLLEQAEDENVQKRQDISTFSDTGTFENSESIEVYADIEKMHTGWYLTDEGWYYYDLLGMKSIGWKRIGQIWYYFDENGLMVSAEKKEIEGDTYWFNESGHMLTGWIEQPEGWYWANEYGRIQTGWQKVGEFTYYFDDSENSLGLMASNCEKVIDGEAYYFGASGRLMTGWLLRPEGWYWLDDNGDKAVGWRMLGQIWYYFDENGSMVSAEKKEIEGDTYWFNESGHMLTGWIEQPEGWYWANEYGRIQTGWQKVGEFTYYFDNSENSLGLMASNCEKVIDGETYYFGVSGRLMTGWLLRPEGWYWLDDNGDKAVGWRMLGQIWYYFDENGLMVSAEKKEIEGDTYWFNESGHMLTGWIEQPEGWYWADQSGRLLSGWQDIGQFRYYFDAENAEYPMLMVANCTKVIDGRAYVFTESGALRTGWIYDNGNYYYYINDELQEGWLQKNGTWYYLDPNNSGVMIHSRWFLIDNEYYYFYDSGAMAKGWLWRSGGWYYLSEYGRMETGWQLIGKDWYYFYKQNDPYGGTWGHMAVNTEIDGYKIGSNGKMISQAIEEIRKYEGYPYVWGGASPAGWDCAGFVQWIYGNIFGISIPRTTGEQYSVTSSVDVSDISAWQEGDLIFFFDGSISHVGIYLGNGEMIHALNEKYDTRIDNVFAYDAWDTGLSLYAIGRIL